MMSALTDDDNDNTLNRFHLWNHKTFDIKKRLPKLKSFSIEYTVEENGCYVSKILTHTHTHTHTYNQTQFLFFVLFFLEFE